jgi:hypothetical protein
MITGRMRQPEHIARAIDTEYFSKNLKVWTTLKRYSCAKATERPPMVGGGETYEGSYSWAAILFLDFALWPV